MRHYYQLAERLASLASRWTLFLSCILLCRGRNAFSRAAGARRDKESIFNMIFEFSAVFTCYLTYYKPIAKKVGLARPPARRGRAVRAK